MIIKLVAAPEMTSASSFSYTQRQRDEKDFSGGASYHVAAMTGVHQMRNRIMIVDDEDDVNVALRIVLEDQFSVDVFNDPFVALDNFKPGLYDLLLIDIRMPRMNGLVLCKKLRKIDSKVKVCFITAGEMVFDFALRNFPDSAILKKPIDNYDLIKEVTRMTNA
jgi:two-component system catabolic regulation response regulator CreB/two-component system response regulator ChvI